MLDGNSKKRGRQASHLVPGYKEGEPVKDGANAALEWQAMSWGGAAEGWWWPVHSKGWFEGCIPVDNLCGLSPNEATSTLVVEVAIQGYICILRTSNSLNSASSGIGPQRFCNEFCYRE